MRKNIWMITKCYPNREDPQFGVFITKHAKAISQFNKISVLYLHPTEIVSGNYEINRNVNSGVSEIIVYYKKNTTVFRKIINTYRYFTAAKKGLKVLNSESPNPDIVHSYILLRTGILAWYISRTKKIPFVISEQWSGFLTGKFMKSSPLRKWLTRFVIRKADAVSCVSAFLFNRMNECGLKNPNFHIIPNVIEIPPAVISSERNIVSVLVVADLVDDIKNISGIIRMIGSIENSDPFILKIIGKGRDEIKLKKLAGELGLLNQKIFFEGLKNNEEVYQYLLNCDFLVMNSRFETFSLICAEAMSCGKPVLATRCGGPNDFVNETTGILIEPDNDEILKKNFLFLLSNYRKFDSVKIKEYVKNLFSNNKVSIDFRTFYESIRR